MDGLNRPRNLGSGTKTNRTNFPPGVSDLPSGTGSVSGNSFKDSQVYFIGSISGSSLHFNSGESYPHAVPRVPAARGGVNGSYSQGQATSTPYREAGQPGDGRSVIEQVLRNL